MGIADVLLRLFGVGVLLILCGILVRTRARDLKALTAIGLAASVGAFLLTSMSRADAVLGVAVYPLTALCSTHPVWFWLAANAMFSDAKAVGRFQFASLLAMACTGVVFQFTGAAALWVLFGVASLAFACLAPVAALLSRDSDLDARRRRIRKWFVPSVALYLALVVATQLIVLFRGGATPRPLVLLNLFVIDAIAVAAVCTFLRFRVVNWLEAADTPSPATLSRLERSVLDRLEARFVREKLYTRPSLSLGDLSSLLGTQEHVLRRVINHGLGFRNFNDFLHSHRLPDIARQLRDPALRRDSVLAIALAAGYGSIGPFNRAFRERFGMTPTEYRRAAFGIGPHSSEFSEPPLS